MINTLNHSYLLEYIKKCKSGEIMIGHELMMQLDKCLAHFEDPEINIDFTEAHKRIKFIETKCKHFEAPFAGKPFLMELFQKAVTEAIYIFKIWDEEINRWVRLYQDVLYLVGRKNGRLFCRCKIGENRWKSKKKRVLFILFN